MRRVAARDLALIAALGLFWGLNWPAVKLILGEVPPFTMRASAFLLAAALLGAGALMRGERIRPAGPGEGLGLALAGLLSIFGFNVLTAYGQLLTETSRAAIIAFTMPLWAALLSAAFLGERLSAPRVAALGLGTAGLAILLGEDIPGFLAAPAGVVVMLGAALSWAAGTVALKSRRWSVGPVALAAWMLGVSAVPATAAALLLEAPWALAPPSPLVAWVFAYHVLLPMVLCYAGWVALVGRLPAAVAAIGTLLIPVVGVLSAALLLGEPLTWQRLAALALVLSSIALALLAPGRRAQSTTPR